MDEKPVTAGSVAAANAREHERVNVVWRARIVVAPDRFLDAKVINASAGGICMICEQPYKVGTALDVAIAIPQPDDRTRIHYTQVRGRVAFQVMNSNQFKVGLQFLSVDEVTIKLIKKWVWH